MGRLMPKSEIIEATSGNTGISLAMIGAKRGYRVKIIMPEGASEERIRLMRAYGAEVILSPKNDGMTGAIDMAKAMEDVGSVALGQFERSVCIDCHYYGTGRELYKDLGGRIDVFISGVGTGATLMGIAKYLKKMKAVRVVAVEPSESAVLSGGLAGRHGIDGIGAGFVPPFYTPELVDEVARVSTDEATEYCRLLAKTEGILVGISTGASLAAAVRIAKREGVNIALILCDRGERYFSRGIFAID